MSITKVQTGSYFHDDDDDDDAIFLDESDIINEIPIDDEDLPDADEDDDDDVLSDSEHVEEFDDSVHIFTGHTVMHHMSQSNGPKGPLLNTGELYSVACSPTDATLVATGGNDDRGFLWKIGQGDWASELHGHKDSVSSLAFSYDGQLLASGGLDGIVRVWDVSGNLKGTLEGPEGGIEWLRWHPREHTLLAGSVDSTVWMWNAGRVNFPNMFVGHSGSVTCGDFTPDGKIICTGSEDKTLRIWNPGSRENIHVVQGHPYHSEGLTCLAISSTSTLALTGSKDGSVHIVNITKGKVINTPASHSKSIECVGFAPSDSWAAIGSLDQKLIIWDIEHSLSRGTCYHEDGVTCLTWLGASYVATGCADGNIRLWDSRSAECVRTFRGHSNNIHSLSVSANRDYLVSSSFDGTARVFELKGLQ